MADTQIRNGVIRSTSDYHPAPLPPEPDSHSPPEPGSPGSQTAQTPSSASNHSPTASTNRENPREIRNKAEKQRRDKLNHSIAELAAIVPTVVAASRKVDKTGVLRLTAHYLRAHQYVFGDAIDEEQQFNAASAQILLSLLKGFLLTTTYRGLVVVVSKNVQQYLGYSDIDLLGQNIFNIVHPEDLHIMRDNLMPQSHLLGPNGELLVPEDPEAKKQLEALLANEKRSFVVRFKKLTQRSEPCQYVSCHIEGSLRKSDRACRGYTRCCQVVRRARARGDNPCNSGNDVVFIGLVRPTCETFKSESSMESYKMEYRTRHSIDGEIIQCEQRIALVTGYMTHEVNGVNAMNFMHRDDVRWVIIALREMYDQHRVVGESCYRLMTKNGQFIYMRTRGQLDVDDDSRAVRSFVCTNTVVDEEEGKHLIRLMKKKFMLLVNNTENVPPEDEIKDVSDNHSIPLEDPRQLEKVILHLVTNLPSPQPEESACSPDVKSPALPLSIIPPKRERIVSAIENFYTIFKTMDPKKPEEPSDRSPDTTTPTIAPRPMPRRVPQPPQPPQYLEHPLYQQNPACLQRPLHPQDPPHSQNPQLPQPPGTSVLTTPPAPCANCCARLPCSSCKTPTCRADIYNFIDENSTNAPMTRYSPPVHRTYYHQPSLFNITAQLRSSAYADVLSINRINGNINGYKSSLFNRSSSSCQHEHLVRPSSARPGPSGVKRTNKEPVTSCNKKSRDELNSKNKPKDIQQANEVNTTQVTQEKPKKESKMAAAQDVDFIDKAMFDATLEYSMRLIVDDLGGPSAVDSMIENEPIEIFSDNQEENTKKNDSDDSSSG